MSAFLLLAYVCNRKPEESWHFLEIRNGTWGEWDEDEENTLFWLTYYRLLCSSDLLVSLFLSCVPIWTQCVGLFFSSGELESLLSTFIILVAIYDFLYHIWSSFSLLNNSPQNERMFTKNWNSNQSSFILALLYLIIIFIILHNDVSIIWAPFRLYI